MGNLFSLLIKLLVLYAFFFFSNATVGQNLISGSVKLKKTYRKPNELLDTLALQTNLQFSFRQSLFDQKKIRVAAGVYQLQELIDIISIKLKIRYTIIGSTIVFKELKLRDEIKSKNISGFVLEDSSGEVIADAYIYFTNSDKVYRTNRQGFFSFLAPPRDSLEINIIAGYRSARSIKIAPKKDTFLVILLPKLKSIKLLTISGKQQKSISPLNEVGIIKLESSKLKSIPPFIGESDPLRPLNFMPGIAKGTEGNNGFFVRGGSPDQNLISLDGGLLFNPSHLLGIFSPFNADAVRNISIQKSGFEADKGSRLSSQINIDLKEGNKYRHECFFSVSPIAISAAANGPLKSPKTTYSIALRRSYLDLVIAPFQPKNVSTGFYFYDGIFKITQRFNAKAKLSITLFASKDKGFSKNSYERDERDAIIRNESNEQNLSWGNQLAVVSYENKIRANVFLESNFYATYFGYSNGINYLRTIDSSGVDIDKYKSNYTYKSNVYNLSSNHAITYWLGRKWRLKSGLGYTYHSFEPSTRRFAIESNQLAQGVLKISDQKVFANETYLFVDARFEYSKYFTLNTGFRYSNYFTSDAVFFNPQPRVSAIFQTKNGIYIKPSYTRTVQYLHFATNNTIGLPVDLWLPVTKNLTPETADQFGLQIQKIYEKINLNIELFHKSMNQLIDYAEGVEYVGNAIKWEDKFEVGSGTSYGIELMVEKKIGNTTGWLSYTLSKNTRRFDSINNGKAFPFKYDRRNDLSIVINQKINKNIDAFIAWTFASGAAITLPSGRYPSVSQDPFQDIYIYTERNGSRLKDFHRLDIVVNFNKQKKKYLRTWSISFFNVYNRQNPFYITPGTDKNGNRSFVQVSLLPFIPSFSYRLSFN